MKQDIKFNSEASPHDSRCSVACSRSAISIYVLCAVGVILFTLLEERKALEAYLKYVSFRGNLRTALERIKNDACLRKIESRIGTGKLYASKLVDIGSMECDLQPQTTPPPIESNTSKRIPTATDKDDLPPAPPMGLLISSRPEEPQKLADLLSELTAQSNLMPLAKRLSYASKYSIDRWLELFGQRLWQSGSRPEVSDDGIWLIPKGDFYKFLTLQDFIAFDSLEYPSLSVIDSAQAHLRIQAPSIPISSDLGTGVMLTQFGLLLSVSYFLLYQREARYSDTFPASGTFFAVFNRTQTRNTIFLFLTALPPIVSLLITSQSQSEIETLVGWSITSLVTLVCVQITYGEGKTRWELQR